MTNPTSSTESVDPAAPSPELAAEPTAPDVTPQEPAPDGRAELRDFFAGVSGFGGRLRRRYHRLVPAPIRSRRGLLVICSVITIGVLVYQSLSARPPAEMPIELQGAWNTTAKGWTDRGFWIGKHQVAFKIGPNHDDVEVFNVTHLATKSVRGDTAVYDIEYAVDGGSSRWSIRHTGLPQPAIIFVHQPQMTWTVTPDLHPPVK